MFAIASCILVAACINFPQVVVALSLPNPLKPLESLGSRGPLGSLLGKDNDVSDQNEAPNGNQLDGVMDALRGVIERGEKTVQKIEDGVIKVTDGVNSRLDTEVQKLKDKSEQFLKEAQDADISPCTRLCKRGRAAVTQLVSMVGSCLLDETQKAGNNIKDLINVTREIKENMSKKSECLQDSFSVSCVRQLLPGVSDVKSMIDHASTSVKAAVQFYTIIPNIQTCLEVTMVKFIRNQLNTDLLKETGMCVQSFFNKNQ